jgi:DNA-binding transcriptional LysR family regulator
MLELLESANAGTRHRRAPICFIVMPVIRNARWRALSGGIIFGRAKRKDRGNVSVDVRQASTSRQSQQGGAGAGAARFGDRDASGVAVNLDIDVLRTLVAAERLGGFGRAADYVGRSHAAVSQKIHKLEDRLGQPLFRKHGRGLVFTEAGETVLGYARRILDLNDQAVASLKADGGSDCVRFGLPSDFSETWLPLALDRFKRACPSIRIEATTDRNTNLADRLARGQIDFAALVSLEADPNAEVLATLPMSWIGNPSVPWSDRDALPLAMFEAPCVFRHAAVAALEAADIRSQVQFTSPGLSALWAAVNVGIGITARVTVGLPRGLKPLSANLPALPPVKLSLHSASQSLTKSTACLRDILLETFSLRSSAAA